MEVTNQDFTDVFGKAFYSPVDAWNYFIKERYPECLQNIPPELQYLHCHSLIEKNVECFKEIARRNHFIYKFQEAHQKINAFCIETLP